MFQEIARLFASPTRIKLIKFFVFQPDLRVPLAHVASILGLSREVAEAELRFLIRFGLLVKRVNKREAFFGLTYKHPLADSLRVFLEKISTPSDTFLMRTLGKMPGLTLLVASGVLAGEDRAAVDLLVITKKPKDAKIARLIKRLEAAVALPLRYAVLESVDYARRLESYDRLLRDVFEYKHRTIFGRR